MVTEAKVCAIPVVLRSLRISTTSPMVLTNLQMTDVMHQVSHHQHHQVYVPRRNLLGSRIRLRMHQRALGFCGHMSSNGRKNWQRTSRWLLNHRTSQHRRKPIELEVTHAVQYGIRPKRLPLPHTDEKILSGIDEDVSSICDGCPLWRCPTHLQRCGTTWRAKDVPNPSSARPLKEDFSPQPKYRFDNNAPNRSVQQTRISILSWNLGPSTRQRRGH